MGAPFVNIVDPLTGNALNVVNGAFPIPTGVNALQPTTNTTVVGSSGNTTVKATPGRLFGITIVSVALSPIVVIDSAGSTVIFNGIASLPLGYYGISGGNPFTQLIVQGAATNPNVVCHYA